MRASRSPLDAVAQDLRYGLRNLSSSPGFAVAAVAVLAIGIGAVTSIYSAVEALVLRPLPYPDLDRLVVLGEVHDTSRPGDEVWTHPADLREWRTLLTFAGLAGLDFSMATVHADAGPERAVAYSVSDDFFDLLGVTPLHGRSLAADDEVVLSHRYWQRGFGGRRKVVGRSVVVDGRARTVVGILPHGAAYPMGTDLWMPLELTDVQWASFESPRLRVVGRLTPGATVAEARQSLAGFASRLQETHLGDQDPRSIRIQSLIDEVAWGSRAALTLLGGASVFLLLLICGSVAHMQLARATTRRGEMALRAALGASRVRLVRQLLTEGMLLASLGAALGAGLALAGTRYIRSQLALEGLRFFFPGVDGIHVDGSALAMALTTSLASTVLFGIVPALRASATAANTSLRGVPGRAAGDVHGARLRRWLIGLQVALSILLVVGAATMVRGTDALSRLGHGLDDEVATLRVQLPESRYDTDARRIGYFATVLERLRRLPGVRHAALSDRLPGRARVPTRELAVEEPSAVPAALPLRASRRVIGGDYLAALEMPLEAGRAFRLGDDAGAPPVALVNRALARHLRADPTAAIGLRVRLSSDEPWARVVGVVGNEPGLDDATPTVYFHYSQSPPAALRFLLRAAADPAATAAAARGLLLTVDDSLPVADVGSVGEILAPRSRGLWLVTDLLSGFAASAFLLTVIGTYALVATNAGRRRRELGIRLALGARRAQVSSLMLREALLPVALGTAAGLAAALALTDQLARHRVLADALDSDPTFLATLSLALLAITALAAYLPARRAGATDPATSLRAD